MKKIMFVNAPNKSKAKNISPLGILNLATILKNRGYNVVIFNFNCCKNDEIINDDQIISEMSEYIIQNNPDIVDFYSVCSSYHLSVAVAKVVREKMPNIKILFGGPQASLTAELSLQAFPWIDVIGIGEGEKTIERIINALDNFSDFDSIPGVAYRKSGQVVCNKEADLIEDLDELPFPDYNLIDLQNIKVINIEPGRGCPFQCTYCSTKTFWKRKFRMKSTERIIDEIKYLKNNYGINTFDLVHDLFTCSKKNVIKFCDAILKEKLDIKWTCSARVDSLDEEMIKKMTECGLDAIFLGLETGSNNMQRKIKKNLNIDEVWPIIDSLIKHKIKITCSLIYNFPDETLDDLRGTLNVVQLAVEKGVKMCQLHELAIFPGTEIFETYKNDLEFCPNRGDSISNIDSDLCIDMIKNNPYIFPQYYSLRSHQSNEYEGLDRFVMLAFPILCKSFKTTYRLLLDYYNNDFLKMHTAFKKININNSIFVKPIEDLVYKLNEKCDISQKDEILGFENFIYTEDFGNITELIREIYKFEHDIYKFLDDDDERMEDIEYSHNVYKLKALGFNENEEYSQPQKLRFNKSNGKLSIKIA